MSKKEHRFGWLIKSLAVLIAFASLAFCCSDIAKEVRRFPDAYYAESGEELLKQLAGSSYPRGMTVTASGSSDESLHGPECTVKCRLFGVFTLKQVSAYIGERAYLVPCGQPVGISIFTEGVLVVGLGSFSDEHGRTVSPASDAGLRAGDVILEANGRAVSSSAQLQGIIDLSSGSVSLHVERDGGFVDITVAPALSRSADGLRIGAWIRDSTVGIGTLSFYDPESGLIAALGHAVVDLDTGTLLKVKDGKLVYADVIGVTKGRSGAPGELHGTFNAQSAVIGTVEGNTELGVFGYAEGEPSFGSAIPVAFPSEVHTGDACIYSSVDDGGVACYSCRIIKTGRQNGPEQKGLVIQITDGELLQMTGGIVQGMSGSPIIQDGRLVGVVTHVFVNDPRKGYGAYAYWMYGTLGGG